jgi:hypothetical protein
MSEVVRVLRHVSNTCSTRFAPRPCMRQPRDAPLRRRGIDGGGTSWRTVIGPAYRGSATSARVVPRRDGTRDHLSALASSFPTRQTTGLCSPSTTRESCCGPHHSCRVMPHGRHGTIPAWWRNLRAQPSSEAAVGEKDDPPGQCGRSRGSSRSGRPSCRHRQCRHYRRSARAFLLVPESRFNAASSDRN